MSADEWKTSLGNVNRDGRGADEEPRDASGIVFSQPLGRLPPRHSAVGFSTVLILGYPLLILFL
jgi:hypothetical protein